MEIPLLCKTCVHYIPPPHILFKKHHAHGKCSLFARVSLVDGEIENELAKDARDNLCRGKFHKDKNHENIKYINETDDSEPGSL